MDDCIASHGGVVGVHSWAIETGSTALRRQEEGDGRGRGRLRCAARLLASLRRPCASIRSWRTQGEKWQEEEGRSSLMQSIDCMHSR